MRAFVLQLCLLIVISFFHRYPQQKNFISHLRDFVDERFNKYYSYRAWNFCVCRRSGEAKAAKFFRAWPETFTAGIPATGVSGLLLHSGNGRRKIRRKMEITLEKR